MLGRSTITGTSPASSYVGIDQSIRYADNTTILAKTAGIVDTGTTLVLLATDAFDSYKNATGAVTDETTGLLKITKEQYNSLKSLFFTINGVSIPVSSTRAFFEDIHNFSHRIGRLRVCPQRPDLASLRTLFSSVIPLIKRN